MIFQQEFKIKTASSIRRFSISVMGMTMLALSLSGCGGEKSAEEPQAVAVKLKTLEPANLIDSSEYVGTLEASDRVNLAPRIDGRILEIFVRQGDRVERGDPIARLEPTQEQEDVNAATQTVNVERARLGQSQAELRTAQANRAAAAAEVESARANLQEIEAEVELATTNIERTRMLVEGGALPQQDLDDDNRDLKSNIAQRNSRRQTLNAAIESLAAAERQVEQAIANIESQNAAIGRAEAELGSVSQNLAYNTISAPIDGVVGSFDDKKVGDYLTVGEELTTITNNNNFELNINIPTEYRDRLKPGLLVETVNKDGSKGVEGEITYIAPLVQQNTQSILAKASFNNENSLRDREYLRVRVIWDEQPGVLVPTTAVSTLGGQNFVFIATEQEAQTDDNTKADSPAERSNGSSSEAPPDGLVAQQQPIKLGNIQDQNYQVISGVKEGDRIAVSNILSLQDGTPIKPAEEEVVSSESSK